MDEILSDSRIFLDEFSPPEIAEKIVKNFKARRLELNITQAELSKKSGVSLGSVKRFESKAQISLKNLLMLAVIINSTDRFLELFSQKQYKSINELTELTKAKKRKRARTNDK